MAIDKICLNEKCTGCSACYNICPQKCIEMNNDKFGVLRPKIEKEKVSM